MPKRGSILLGSAVLTVGSIAYVYGLANGDERVRTEAKSSAEVPVAQVSVVARAAAPVRTARRNIRRATPKNALRRTNAFLAIVDQPDIRAEDKPMINGALRWFPALCRDNVRNLVVQYGNAADRGLATSSTILIRGGMEKGETVAVLLHECGHIIDLGGLTGTPGAGRSPYPDGSIPTYRDDPSAGFYAISWETSTKLRDGARREDFVSGYASEDPFEDVAETILYYALHHRAFEQRAAENPSLARKYAWVREHVFGPNFEPVTSAEWDGEIAWDATKLKHRLEL